MSVQIYDPVTDTLHKVGGLVDDTDLKQDIEDIQAVIPSNASAANQLATGNDIPVMTQWIAANNTVTYRKVEIKLPSIAGVIQLTTKSGDVYCISKRDGSSIKFTKVVNGVGGDVVTLSGYSFDTLENVLTLYLTMQAWSSIRIDVLNAWSSAGQHSATITVTVIEQSQISGTTPTIINTLVNSDLTSSITSGSTAPITSGGVYSAMNTVTSGTATNTSNVTSGTCTWVKVGRMVTVTINAFTPVEYSGGDRQLATGLPKPIAYTAWGVQDVGGTINQLFSIGTDGVLMGASGSMKTGRYYQSFTYVCSS